jgi:7-keto-8-aminopelargonate synthetase-like enzyme
MCIRDSLVETLKNLAPGFVFSVGMSPPLAAAARTALDIMLREPGRVAALQNLSRFFLEHARFLGLDTGRAEGHAVEPVMIGSKAEAFFLAKMLAAHGVSVMPLAHPAVEENAARLRFFLSAAHSENDIRQALATVAELLPQARTMAASAIHLASQGRF